MNFIRTTALRRDPSSEGQIPDSQERQLEMDEQTGSRTRGFSISRPHMPTLFTSLSRTGGNGRRVESDRTEDGNESPKSPDMPSSRLHLPNLARTWTRASSPDERAPESIPQPSLSRTQTEQHPIISEPAPSHIRNGSRSDGAQHPRFRGADPGETQLADDVDRGRHRRHRSRRGEHNERPKRFLFCFPWIRSRRMRSLILRCFVSGIFLMLMLAVYLALSITKNVNSNEFTILLVLIILFVTLFFCHGLVRICLLILKPPNENDEERPPIPQLLEPGGYAIPRRPIHVILTRDEEAAGIDSPANKLEPPAYGIWRESVRVDPNRLYWQRNEQPPSEGDDEDHSRPETVHTRPPSYASEDGVSYVVEARPRSMVPLTDVPLPPHPFEANHLPTTERV
ncbi:hypothetical protein M426DRAFT_191722 [Hypoxylon sp. CI-4A]|nr:hypothetical protein M426DRAFT_191722 [Hypoxylon sp. CI-4A]